VWWREFDFLNISSDLSPIWIQPTSAFRHRFNDVLVLRFEIRIDFNFDIIR
jgi:hypothetical protein